MRYIAPAGNEVVICCNQDKVVGIVECSCVAPGDACKSPEEALKRHRIRAVNKIPDYPISGAA